MKLVWRILIGCVAVLGVAAAGAFLYLRAPVEPEAYADTVSYETRDRNNDVATLLQASDITEALVDATPERVYVAFENPTPNDPSPARDPDVYMLNALAAAGAGSPDSAQIVLVQYVEGAPKLLWETAMADYRAWADGKATIGEFVAKLKVTQL